MLSLILKKYLVFVKVSKPFHEVPEHFKTIISNPTDFVWMLVSVSVNEPLP